MSIANISSPEDSYGRHGNLLPPGEIENCCMPRSLMLSAGIGENSLMLSAGIGENSLMLSAGIGENYLMPSAGIGVNSLMPMSSAGIGENSLMPMPSAGIGENSLMPNASMNSQEEEFSGDLGFQPSTSFENPNPPMMRMSYPEYIHKVSGDSSQHERVTPTNDQNFQDGENEQLLNHNQINYSMLCIGQKRRFKELDTEEQCNSEQSPMRKNKNLPGKSLSKRKLGMK
ncbi:hypothetical protein GOBAR_AA05510 [Gossypium barbadense]|uniref:Uncharacterized protein n=1 Tax=Gossypium barbadense TaxID=3634 RepID=A0A2P5YHN5_GOSBA|nr:hypothetical protein GOBAR_AA05510 [Gossypium barbadense]